MKIRTDFVTNSSCSNFSIVVAIETKDGITYSFEENGYEIDEDQGGTCMVTYPLMPVIVFCDNEKRVFNIGGNHYASNYKVSG